MDEPQVFAEATTTPPLSAPMDFDVLENEVVQYHKELQTTDDIGDIGDRNDIVMWPEKMTVFAKYKFPWKPKKKAQAADFEKTMRHLADSYPWTHKPGFSFDRDQSTNITTLVFVWHT